MASNVRTSSVSDDIGKLILRLVVGALLLFHGTAKLRHGIEFISKTVQSHNLPTWFAYGVYVGEVLGPILLILGILTRPAALAVAIDMVVAIALVVQGQAMQIARQTGALSGELPFLYLFGALAIAFLGSGRFAVSRGQGRFD